MKILLMVLTLFSLQSLAQADTALKPFVTDYCTSYPEGTLKDPIAWKHCCEEHDLFFWAGGSLADRKATDLRLKACVTKSGHPTQAQLIYTAVTIGGHSPIRFKTKEWGHAWGDSRQRYISLSEQETSRIVHYLETYHTNLSAELKQTFKEQLNSRLDSK